MRNRGHFQDLLFNLTILTRSKIDRILLFSVMGVCFGVGTNDYSVKRCWIGRSWTLDLVPSLELVISEKRHDDGTHQPNNSGCPRHELRTVSSNVRLGLEKKIGIGASIRYIMNEI